jgi:hypothetical protein
MENLPIELWLSIIRYVTATECLRLAQTSKAFTWVINEKSLWKHYVDRDLQVSVEQFERQLIETGGRPIDLYRNLSQCHHLTYIVDSGASIRCHHRTFRGSTYCRDHMVDHLVGLCPCCENEAIDTLKHPYKMNVICRTCRETEAFLRACQATVDLGPYGNHRCHHKRAPGSNYCSFCLKYRVVNLETPFNWMSEFVDATIYPVGNSENPYGMTSGRLIIDDTTLRPVW